MNCDDVIGYMSPYIDSELDPTTTFQIQTHLSRCATCHDRYESASRLDRRIAHALKAIPSRRENDLTWNHLLNAAIARPQRHARSSGWRTGFFRHSTRLYWTLLVATLILLAFSSLNGIGLRHLSAPNHPGSARAVRFGQDMREAAVSQHVGFINAEWQPELVTKSHESMKRYFAQNNMSIPDNRADHDDVQMIGASCSDLNGVPAACILCRYHGKLVTMYVLDHDRPLPEVDDGASRYRSTNRAIGNHTILAVHDRDTEDIGQLIALFDEADEHPDPSTTVE